MVDRIPVSKIFIVSVYILSLFPGLGSSNVCAQSYNFEVQTIPLRGDFINFSGKCFLQDSEGFIWLGSSEGLYRYHGTGVKIYRHLPNTEYSLSNNFIMDLYEDSEGVIWIGTKDGLNRFDKYTETFKCYRNREGDSTSITRGEINKIAEDSDGNLWIANGDGFNLFDRKTETFENYRILRDPEAAIKDPYQIFNLIPDREYLWLSTGDGLYRYSVPTGNMEQIKEAITPIPWGVFIDRSGRYWLPCYGGLLLLDAQDLSYKPFPNRPGNSKKITNQNVQTMLEDGSGNIWISSLEGIYCYNQALELKYYLEHSTLFPPGYGGQEMSKEMFMDNMGAIWYFTPEGIKQIRNIGMNFRSYTSAQDVVSWINCIHLESKNQVWFGTLHGIISLDRSEEIYKLHYGNPIWLQGFPHSVNTMFSDREGTLWIGMLTGGLISMGRSDKGEVSFRKHWPVNVDSSRMEEYGFYGIRHLFEDGEGRLWVGSGQEFALQFYDRAENRMIRLINNPSSTDRLPEKAIMRLQTGSDTLWAIGSSGVYKIIQPLDRISKDEVISADVIQCRLVCNDRENIEINSVTFTYMDSMGDLWLGSSGSGLYRIIGARSPSQTGNEYMVKNYTTQQGLPGNGVLSMLPDGRGNLWMGTDNGLSKFNLVTETFTNYYVRHGLPVNEFKYRSSAIGEDGEMYFGTIASMISFYPDSINTNQNVPPIRLTDIKINNKLLQPENDTELEKTITFTDKIELNYNQDNLSIEYAILNYDNPELNQYRYILEGFNDDWVYAGNRTKVDFTNLRHGRYTFRVLGSNDEGTWNEKGASLQITILPPPWQTWYAYLVYGLLLVGIILWYRRYQQIRVNLQMVVEVEKIEKEKVQEINQMKSRFFANISHEFRTPLTLILGPLEKLIKSKKENIELSPDSVGIMYRNATRLHRLINQLLDVSKMEAGKLSLQVSDGDLTEFSRSIIASFNSLAESKVINYKYALPETPQGVLFDRDKVEKILGNLISNAFKFTPEGGTVEVGLTYSPIKPSTEPEYAEIKVADTGIGIPQDQLSKIFERFFQVNDTETLDVEGTGIGLALVKELVDLHHGEISVLSEPGKGSTFTVKLPVSEGSFKPDEIDAGTSNSITGRGYAVSNNEVAAPIGIDPEQETVAAAGSGKPQILIVEDHADLRNYIAESLESSYCLLMAEDGISGLEMARESIPDLVISDVMMPGMDGITMCDRLKSDERTDHIPLILLTARADRESKLDGFETGADAYLIKPFDMEELQVRIRSLLDQRNKLREHFQTEYFSLNGGVEIHIGDPFLKRFFAILDQHISDADFRVNQLSGELNLSRSQLFRKVMSLTGSTPVELLRARRLAKAAELFLNGHDQVATVMHSVGYNHQSYFSKCFSELYGKPPSQFIREQASGA